MVELPSGRVIDLSTDRAKYHALRQQGVGLQSEHRKLYALVDIIYRTRDENGRIKRGGSEFDYAYSGYTLDSVRQAQDWSSEDKAALSRWIQLDDQRRCIETARRRLVENQPQLTAKNYTACCESVWSSYHYNAPVPHNGWRPSKT